jgi:O-antigen ligase
MYSADRFGVRTAPPSKLPFLLLVPLVIAGLVDLPGDFREGTISMLGILGAVQLAVAVAGLFLARVYPRRVLSRFLPYGLFLGWMTARSVVEWPYQGGPEQGGLQNGLAYGLFGAEFLLGATLAALAPTAVLPVLRRGFVVLDAVALFLVAISVPQGLPGVDFLGQWWVSPRSVALVAIVPLAWHLASWCHGHSFSGARALLWVLAVLTSLSRTGTAIAVLLFAIALFVHAWLTPGKLLRRSPLAAIAVATVAIVVFTYQSTFYQRFFEGYTRVEVGGVSLSTSGRSKMWPIVFDSAMRHPISGGGLGSSQIALGEYIHPHNEYLRVWHDGGFIGLGLLLFAFTRWLVLLRRQYVHAVRASQPNPAIDLAALLALLGLILAAITDNGLMYMFVVAPCGILIGAAFGVRALADTPRSPTIARYAEAPLGA